MFKHVIITICIFLVCVSADYILNYHIGLNASKSLILKACLAYLGISIVLSIVLSLIVKLIVWLLSLALGPFFVILLAITAAILIPLGIIMFLVA